MKEAGNRECTELLKHKKKTFYGAQFYPESAQSGLILRARTVRRTKIIKNFMVE